MNKKNGMWRTTTRKGERVLIDPQGNAYHGTAQEVRDAALTPRTREWLAESIQLARYVAAQFHYTPDQRREYVRKKRREAIRHDRTFVSRSIDIPADVNIMLRAGARLVGYNFDEFIGDLWQSEISALLDLAETETGKRELPLTRHERAALDRIRGRRCA